MGRLNGLFVKSSGSSDGYASGGDSEGGLCGYGAGLSVMEERVRLSILGLVGD